MNSLEPLNFKIRAGGKYAPQVEVAWFQEEQMQLGSVHPPLSSSHSISENRYTQMSTSYKLSKDHINLEIKGSQCGRFHRQQEHKTYPTNSSSSVKQKQ